jgi:flagellar protein FliL
MLWAGASARQLERKIRRKFRCGVDMKYPLGKLFASAVLLIAVPVFANSGGPKMAEGVNYIEISPALVVNYGGPGKARFIKAELSLRAENAEDALEVTHHLPLIRDRLVSILSAQTEAVISTPEGKEYLRVYALAEINKALLKVEGHDVDGHDEHGAADAKHAPDATHGAEKPAAHDTSVNGHEAEPVLPSAADVKPVKGPASDLFFNNFVVQK